MELIMALLQLFSGTASGFITNKFAVKWLFKPVEVFGHKIFDVSLLSTEEKQEKFIDSLAECVEKNVLTHDVLEKEICSPKMQKHIEDIIESLFSNSLRDSVGNKKICELEGFDEFKTALNDEISAIADDILPELSDILSKSIDISDIVSEKQAERLVGELASYVDNDDFTDTNALLHSFVSDTLDKTDITELTRRIMTALNPRAMDIDSTVLSRVITAHVNTPKFRSLLTANALRLIELLKTVDMRIYDILSPEFCDKLDELVRMLVPKAVPAIVDFIDTNRHEIEDLIEDAVYKTHNKSAGIVSGIFKMINVPDRLISMVNEMQSEDSDEISRKVLFFLQTTTLGKLTSELERYITPDRIAGAVVGLINKYGERAARHAVEYFRKNIDTIAVNYAKNNGEKIRSALKEAAVQRLSAADAASLAAKAPHTAARLLRSGLKNIKITDDMLKNGVVTLADSAADMYQNRHISAIVRLLNRDTELKKQISAGIFSYLENNVAHLLEGNVKRTVKATLGRLDTDQLLDVAMKLMSGELKYLSYFGGLLGFLISLFILPLTMRFSNVYGFMSSPWAAVINAAAMAFIGIITNVVAIGMFFRPYKPMKLLTKNKYTKLISQGLILQNQSRFAKIMGNYINDELITPESIGKIFESNKATFSSAAANAAVPFASKYITEKKGTLASKLKNAALSTLNGASKTISKLKIGSLLGKFSAKGRLSHLSGKTPADASDKLETAAERFLAAPPQKLVLGDAVLNTAVSLSDKAIDKLDGKMVKSLTDNIIRKYVLTGSNAKTIGDMLNPSLKGYVNEALGDLTEGLCGYLIKKASELIDKTMNTSNPMLALGLMAVGDTPNYLKTVSIPRYITSKTSDIEQLIRDFIENTVYTANSSVIRNAAENITIDADELMDRYKLRPFLKATAASALMSLKGEDIMAYASHDDTVKLWDAMVRPINTRKFAAAICSVPAVLPEMTAVENDIDKFIKRLSPVMIGDIADKDELDRSVSDAAASLMQNGANGALYDGAYKLLDREGDLHIINNDLCRSLLYPAADAAYRSVAENAPDIVRDIDFYGVTKEKINSLKPNEIEALIRSFADDAFRKLYALGVIGVVFGINSYASIAVTVIDAISDKVKERKSKDS